ncbi:transcription factor GTE8-like isoform X2 [Diospyros lotus]|nr:transcription factor GTE8-like isoform X2 [Diospyros lotus]
MIATENIPKKKLKIKIGGPKCIDVEPGRKSCEFVQQEFMNDDSGHNVPVTGSIKSEKNQSHNLVIPSDNTKKCAAGNLKVGISEVSSHKRGLQGVGDGQKEKRRKLERGVTLQCSSILKHLMAHSFGWIFNEPVDPVKLEIPDYLSIISHPMDLGTIKTKLEKNRYSNVEEFAADVRLTFSNAMEYNPPSNEVHLMAKKLNDIFNARWRCLEAKWSHGYNIVEQGPISSGRAKGTDNLEQNDSKTHRLHVKSLPKRLMSAEDKQKLQKQLLELSRENMSQQLQCFLKKFGNTWRKEGRIEVDIDAFDDETLWKMKRIISTRGAKAAKSEAAKNIENGTRHSLGKIAYKGTDSSTRTACGSVSVSPPLDLDVPKCCSCGSMRCQCSLQNDLASALSSDLSSERSLGHDHDASKKDCGTKILLQTQMIKSNLDSDGAVSSLGKEHFCLSQQLSSVATTATYGGDWTPLIDIQLSPKKALRAAMLKSRFADTILKAKQKALLDDGDKVDPIKMQQEKERLERQQLEEKARIEAQIRAAEAASRMKAEAELKMQRERAREAARLALLKMEKTVEIDDNLEILKELEMLCGCSLSKNMLCNVRAETVVGCAERVRFSSPLEWLGLSRKDDYMDEEDEAAILGRGGDGEEGEIIS